MVESNSASHGEPYYYQVDMKTMKVPKNQDGPAK